MIDPINALACGGAEAPFNMQWQSVAEGKAKDKWEGKLWSYILNIGVTGHSWLLYALSGYSWIFTVGLFRAGIKKPTLHGLHLLSAIA